MFLQSQAAMFSDITKQPQLQISRQGMDVKLIESRVKFLKRAVSSAVQLIEKTVNQVILAFFMCIFTILILFILTVFKASYLKKIIPRLFCVMEVVAKNNCP